MSKHMLSKLRGSADVLRLIFAASLGCLILVIGLFTLTGTQAMDLLWKAGYWFVLSTFGVFVWVLVRNARSIQGELVWVKADWFCLIGLFFAGIVLLVHEPAGFKILMDEIHLLGTSMAMHFERSVFVPQRASDLQGIFELTGGMVDKRPLFFPFLVSIIHDLTGYRPENVFVLNALLTWTLLTLSYLAGRSVSGRLAGLLAAGWWLTLPLLGQNARGGGFELLNVVMILATALLAGWHYRQRDAWSMAALIYSGVLLAQTRYESPLFLAPVAAIILLVWWEDRRICVPWVVACVPLFLLPVPLLMRIFQARPESWEMASKPGTMAAFSVTNIPDNAAHAIAFWFNMGMEQPNSPVLAGVGIIAAVLCIVRLRRWILGWTNEPPAVRAGLFFMAGILVHLGLMLCYFWGKFDEPVIRRLSLPTYLLMVFAPLFAVSGTRRVERWHAGLLAAAALGFVYSGVPGLARQAATRLYYPALDTAWRREFMRFFPEKDYLVIDNDASVWITHEVSATGIQRAKDQPGIIAFNLRNRMFSAIYVFQRFDIDAGTGALKVRSDDDLGQAYELEVVAERTFRVDVLSRLSRIKAIQLEKGERAEAAPIASVIDVKAAERGTRERLLLAEWLKNLP